jgi:FdrA protein
MTLLSKVFPNTYRDSVLLMKIASLVRSMEGVENAEVMMGTEPNKGMLLQSQLFTEEVENAKPTDLVISIMAGDYQIAERAIHEAEEMVMRGLVISEEINVAKSINSALAMLPEANLALISIPGFYVKKEALKALKKNLNLMIFSDHVTIEDELEIKETAALSGLFVMGPDCGTAIINGVALGFANRVRAGTVGLVGASGTGLQEISSLLHNFGAGISHAIGTGSNDVNERIGGMTMRHGISLLDGDPSTEIIVVVSKPPSSSIMERILARLQQCKKPVIANFLGVHKQPFVEGNILFTVTLEETALKAAEKMGLLLEPKRSGPDHKRLSKEKSHLSDTQKYIRGLFSGGTLATEAAIIINETLHSLSGNISLKGVRKLPDPNISEGHCIIDLGADEFTLGKPHPMIVPQMRRERLLAEAGDSETAVILMDFVLGYGAHPNPVGETIPLLKIASRIARENGRALYFVASVCGTDEDPQNKTAQVKMLQEQGVFVLPSNAQAAKAALSIVI